MTVPSVTAGFAEIPEEYRPKRMEYYACDDSNTIMTWAIPRTKGSSTWFVYLNEAVGEGVGLPRLHFGQPIKEVDQIEARAWVIGLGMLAEAWLFRTRP